MWLHKIPFFLTSKRLKFLLLSHPWILRFYCQICFPSSHNEKLVEDNTSKSALRPLPVVINKTRQMHISYISNISGNLDLWHNYFTIFMFENCVRVSEPPKKKQVPYQVLLTLDPNIVTMCPKYSMFYSKYLQLFKKQQKKLGYSVAKNGVFSNQQG